MDLRIPYIRRVVLVTGLLLALGPALGSPARAADERRPGDAGFDA